MRADILNARSGSADFARRWADRAEVRSVTDRFDALGKDADQAIAAARSILSDPGLVDGLIAAPLAALAGDPFFDPPFRVSRDAVRMTAILIEHPAARLSVTVLDAAAVRAMRFPDRFVIPGRVSVSRHVRAAGAILHCWRTEAATDDFRLDDAPACRRLAPERLKAGAITVQDGRIEGQILWPGTADTMAVTITLASPAAPLVREGDIETGRIRRAAAPTVAASRRTMLLRLVRELGRTDADPVFDAASRDPAFYLRWDAMREWLMLGGAAPGRRLTELAADDPHPDVRAAANATLAAIARRNAPCP